MLKRKIEKLEQMQRNRNGKGGVYLYFKDEDLGTATITKGPDVVFNGNLLEAESFIDTLEGTIISFVGEAELAD